MYLISITYYIVRDKLFPAFGFGGKIGGKVR